MTIEFVAANTKDPNCLIAPGTILLALSVLCGFVKLARRLAKAGGKERLIILDGFFDNGLDGFTIVSRGGSG